jgi:hypothetical protein
MGRYEADDAERVLVENGAANPPCPACQRTEWTYSPHLTILRGEGEGESFAEGGMGLGESAADAPRVATVICRGCGFVRFHDLTVLR